MYAAVRARNGSLKHRAGKARIEQKPGLNKPDRTDASDFSSELER